MSLESENAFGSGELYVEEFMARARHIEVQVVGDAHGAVTHLGERDCSVQRRHQKLLELAPAPGLQDEHRSQLIASAIKLAEACQYSNIGTFEFLVNANDHSRFAFIEANPRLQVEHTVTEEVMGVDLVEVQLRLAGGERLADLDLPDGMRPTGHAIQCRVNMETMQPDGTTLPSGGVITAFNPASGPGVRSDTFGYAGYSTNPRFDSLLGKLVVHHRGAFDDTLTRTYRALCEYEVGGVRTNLDLLAALVMRPELRNGQFHTRFVDDCLTELIDASDRPRLFFDGGATNSSASPGPRATAGAAVDTSDPLAVLDYGKLSTAGVAATADTAPGEHAVLAPMQGTVIQVMQRVGDEVSPSTTLVILDAMKMEHEIKAGAAGIIDRITIHEGDTIYEQHPLLVIRLQDVEDLEPAEQEDIDLDHIRGDLAEVQARRRTTLDEARPDAVQRRADKDQRTARTNVLDLVDADTFVEYGSLVLAAQRRRRSIDELIEKSPADGMITGVGAINAHLFDDPDSRCVIMSYDYTVFAGTQGAQNHRKTDRMVSIAENGRMPVVLFAEGGGGRPGDTDGIAGSTTTTFARFAQLSGLVPMVGITSGRCFAGNASLLGCCDVIIATANANIGMGGPAMIEGGGLGIFSPEEIGPLSVQIKSGVVDIAVSDEADAVRVAKQYLSYFQGRVSQWQAPDQRAMRNIVPENRLRIYDVRRVINTLADVDTVLELRPGFGVGMITSLIRIEGRPVGVIANNPAHLGGAIDSDGADKGARFMQLLDAFDIPLLHLCDTPGIMVGPEIEKTALVRHSSRMFITGANLSIPYFTIVLRKAYGLGAIAMAGGSYKTPFFSVAWPTGEFGGMGLEGSVKLGYRAELAAIEDPDERRERYEEMVERAYQTGKALNYASLFSVDDTIDPADSRRWLVNLLKSVRVSPRSGKKRPAVDAW